VDIVTKLSPAGSWMDSEVQADVDGMARSSWGLIRIPLCRPNVVVERAASGPARQRCVVVVSCRGARMRAVMIGELEGANLLRRLAAGRRHLDSLIAAICGLSERYLDIAHLLTLSSRSITLIVLPKGKGVRAVDCDGAVR